MDLQNLKMMDSEQLMEKWLLSGIDEETLWIIQGSVLLF